MKRFIVVCILVSILSAILPALSALLPIATGSDTFADNQRADNQSIIASAQTPNKYVLDAKLDYEGASLDVNETATYTNATLNTLNSIVFNVTTAHFKAFSLQESSVDGTPVVPKIDGVVMELPLPKPLQPKQQAQIQLAFTLDVPQQGGRFGMSQGILSLGNWYPVFAAYRDGWDRHQYKDFGDPFFTEFGDYDVTLTVSSDVKVAHSGDLISHDGNTWRMKGDELRDFALAISDKYETKSVDVNGATLTAFYLPHDKAVGALYVESAERAVKWYEANIGPYPHQTLDVAEVGAGGTDMVGQEYPGVVFIASTLTDTTGGMGSYLAYAVAHEVGHQWFYAQVGNAQTEDGWMAEALVTNLAYRVIDWPPLTLKSPAVTPAGNSPVNPSIYDFKDESTYVAAVYGKGAVFLQELSNVMGDETYYKMLRAYLQMYQYKIARPQDFLSLAQSFTKTNLNPIIKKYFTYAEYKANSAPTLEVNWPSGNSWQGSVDIPFNTDVAVSQAVVEVDDQIILQQDNPSSPLKIDVSPLLPGDYVVHVAITTANGGFAEQARRLEITNTPPTPTVSSQTQPTSQIVSVSNSISVTVGNLIKPVTTVNAPLYLLYGGGATLGLVALVLVGLTIKYVRRPSIELEYPMKVKKKK